MPLQFYLTADSAPYTPSTWKGGWDKTSDAITRRLDSTKTTADLTKFVIEAVSSIESDASPIYRVALARFVSGQLLAQDISGTVQIMAGVESSSIAAELYYSLHIWVTEGDTDTARGTLLGQFSELASSNNPFPFTPKGRDMMVTAALSALKIEDNDRLVVEIGYIARNNTATQYTGTLYYGTDFYSNGSPDMTRDI